VNSGEGSCTRTPSPQYDAIFFSSNSNLAFYKAMRKENISIPRIVGGYNLRWRQLKHSGSGFDEWMIDQVVVSQALQTGPAWVC
jgi:hypothetical protein